MRTALVALVRQALLVAPGVIRVRSPEIDLAVRHRVITASRGMKLDFKFGFRGGSRRLTTRAGMNVSLRARVRPNASTVDAFMNLGRGISHRRPVALTETG
jgi:hypothetical protein